MAQKKMKRILKSILVAYIIALFCILPGHEVAAFTIKEERQVGEKLLYTIRKSFDVLDEPDLKQYLRKLGIEVLGAAGIQFFDYHFYVIENDDFNAFAAPSGLIFFHSGLIEKMESENELVSVLAHEIGHVAKRHISSRIKKGKQISVATMGLMLAAIALGGGVGSQALMAGSMAAGQSASLHYSRLDEEEADLLAYDWMIKLGRNPEGQVKMLQTMRRIARYRSGMIPQYLLTHPNPEYRLNYVQSLIDSDRGELKELNEGNDIQFLRFKYRVMSQTRDTRYQRKYFASVLSSPRADELDQVMAEYGLAQLDRKENNFEQSLKRLTKVIEAVDETNGFLVDKGVIEFESGKSDQAYKTLTAAYNLDRNDNYAAFSLAQVSFKLGFLERAEQLYKSVMYDMPDLSRVYFELGRLSSAKGASPESKYYLGKYYLYQGNLNHAKNNFDMAIASKELPEELLKDAKESLETIKRLKE